MTQNLSQQAESVMSPIDGPIHPQATRHVYATIPKYLQNLIFFKCRR